MWYISGNRDEAMIENPNATSSIGHARASIFRSASVCIAASATALRRCSSRSSGKKF